MSNGFFGLIADIYSGELKARREINKRLAKEVKLYEGGRSSRARSDSGPIRSPEDSVSQLERLKMVEAARELEENFPLASLILDTFEIYALGDVRYQPMTGNPEINQRYMDYIRRWMDDCDYQGRFDFQQMARLALRGKKRDGESGIVHRMLDGEYKIQLISGDRIGNPSIILGMTTTNYNGIIVDDEGRPVAYDIYTRKPNTFTYLFDTQIPKAYFSHLFDPFLIDQYHGVTAFKSIITRMKDLKETMDYSRINIKYRSTQLPYYKTESGDAPDAVTPKDRFLSATAKAAAKKRDVDGLQLVNVQGGEQQILKTTEGIFEFPRDFPNQQFLPMVETEIREIMSGVKLNYEFAWDLSGMTGTVGRLIVEKSDRVMQDERKQMERQFMRQSVMRAIQSGIDRGLIPDHEAKYHGQFFYGRRISADYGRDARADIDLVNAGLLTETEYHHIHGHDPEEMRRVNVSETVRTIQDAKQVAKETGAPVEHVLPYLRRLYPNPPQTAFGINESIEGEAGEPLVNSVGTNAAKTIADALTAYSQGEITKEAAKGLLVDIYGLDADAAEKMLDSQESVTVSESEDGQPGKHGQSVSQKTLTANKNRTV